MTVNISFSVLDVTIAEQLRTQGLKFDRDKVHKLQQDADAVTRLYVRGTISRSDAAKARKRIVKSVMKAIQQ